MPHIHTEPGQHDHTASGYIIRTDLSEPKLLLHRHKKLGKYIQFGGHIELNETPWQALTHELEEESGYDMSQLLILQPKSRVKSLTHAKLHPIPVCHNTHNFNDNHFHTDLGYAFVAASAPKGTIGDDESKDILMVSRQELEKMPSDETFESVREIGLFIFDTCLDEWVATELDNFA